MFKNLVNFFKCCKYQNKPQNQCLESFPCKESEKFPTENFNKYKTTPSNVSESCKNTNVNTSPSINDKEKTPERKTERDLRVNDDEINPITENIKKEENNNVIGKNSMIREYKTGKKNQINSNNRDNELLKVEEDLNIEKNIVNNYASNDKLFDLIKESDCNKINIEDEILQIEKENKEKKETDKIIVTDKYKTEDEHIEKEDFDKIIVADKYIREDEKNMLVWSKNGIINFINKIINLDDYTEIKTKEIGLDLRIRKCGCDLNKSIYVVKAIYKVARKEFANGISLEFIKNLMYIPELRLSWDDAFKEFTIVEGNNEVYVVKSWFKSPMFIISERDFVDKRIEFMKDDIYYNFCSSLDEKFIPENKGVVRCKNYMNVFFAYQDEEYYYFNTINQCDVKVYKFF